MLHCRTAMETPAASATNARAASTRPASGGPFPLMIVAFDACAPAGGALGCAIGESVSSPRQEVPSELDPVGGAGGCSARGQARVRGGPGALVPWGDRRLV